MTDLRAPFPWFGGKSKVAPIVWPRLGEVNNYVEPFFGSGAVLLGRPGGAQGIETVNDKDGFLCNFWRSVQHDPEETAHWADYPVNESDLHARHIWLRENSGDLSRLLEGDPDYFDAKVAGWWVWGICCWIGGGWCGPSGEGPWVVETGEDGRRRLVKGNAGVGVHRKRVHLNAGVGVHRKRVHLGDWFAALADRLRRVRVCCGDWSRVCGPTPTFKHGLTAVFLDPPYDLVERDGGCYTEDTPGLAQDVLQWCIANGDNPLLRIALCGYEGEHDTLQELGWEVVAWKANGGYGNQSNARGKANAHRERIWFSPHCVGTETEGEMQLCMWDGHD